MVVFRVKGAHLATAAVHQHRTAAAVYLCVFAFTGLCFHRPSLISGSFSPASDHLRTAEGSPSAPMQPCGLQAAANLSQDKPGPWKVHPLMNEDEYPWPGTDSPNQPADCAEFKCRRNLICNVTDPSCCSFWMLDLLDFMGWHLSTKNYKWVMAYGTLLGAYRNHTLFPWDKDVDTAVEPKVWDLIGAPSNKTTDLGLKREAWRHGYAIHMSKWFTLGRICHHPGNPLLIANKQHLEEGDTLPWIDMFEMKPEEGKDSYTIESWKAGMGTPNTTVTFTALYNINDLMLPGVDDYETYLSDLYGDFRTQRIDEYRPTP